MQAPSPCCCATTTCRCTCCRSPGGCLPMPRPWWPRRSTRSPDSRPPRASTSGGSLSARHRSGVGRPPGTSAARSSAHPSEHAMRRATTGTRPTGETPHTLVAVTSPWPATRVLAAQLLRSAGDELRQSIAQDIEQRYGGSVVEEPLTPQELCGNLRAAVYRAPDQVEQRGHDRVAGQRQLELVARQRASLGELRVGRGPEALLRGGRAARASAALLPQLHCSCAGHVPLRPQLRRSCGAAPGMCGLMPRCAAWQKGRVVGTGGCWLEPEWRSVPCWSS
jgi:hypothetical protein